MIFLAKITWGAAHWLAPAILVGIAFTALIIWAYRGGRGGSRLGLAIALKLVGIGILLACLLEPLISGVRPKPGANLVAILLDNSESMRIEDRGLPEISEIKEQLAASDSSWRTRLEQDFDLRIYRVDQDLEQVSDAEALDFAGRASNINSALDTLNRRFLDRPLAGVFVMSDGNATDTTDRRLPSTQDSYQFPIYPVVGKTTAQPRDVAIANVSVSQTHFETSPTIVTADVVAHKMVGESLVVRLTDEFGSLKEEQEIQAAADGKPVAIRFRFRPEEAGLSFYRLQVTTAADAEKSPTSSSTQEATLANNFRTVLIERGSGPYRILYIAGRPNWEFKFLRRALERDEEVRLVGLLRIAKKEPKFQFRDQSNADSNRLFQGFDGEDEEDVEAYDQPVLVRIGVSDSLELAAGFPKTEDVLYPYDAVIIDDVEANFFSPDQMLLLRRYVSQRGAGLLMLGGVDTFGHGRYAKTPVGEMLPVYLDSKRLTESGAQYRMKLTREGMLETWARLRATAADEADRQSEMPGFTTISSAGRVKPGAVQVATISNGDNEQPAIATQRFGRGRTAAFLLGDSWRWSLRRPNADDDDLGLFWRQAIRWLVADVPQRVEVAINRNPSGTELAISVTVQTPEFQPDDGATVELLVSAPGDAEPLKLTAESSRDRVGVYEASFSPRGDGGYRVEAQVVAGDGEVLPPAEAGWVTAPAEREFEQLQVNKDYLEALASSSEGETVTPEELMSFVDRLESRPAPVTERWVAPLWHRGWVLCLAITCLCGEWGLRRWKGMA